MTAARRGGAATAIAAVALAKVGMHEAALELARALITELRADPKLLGDDLEGPLPDAIRLLGVEAVDDLVALRDEAARLPKPGERAHALSILALSLGNVGRDEDALMCARQAFDAARADGHRTTFQLLGDLADVLARFESGKLLRTTYEGYRRIREILLPRD